MTSFSQVMASLRQHTSLSPTTPNGSLTTLCVCPISPNMLSSVKNLNLYLQARCCSRSVRRPSVRRDTCIHISAGTFHIIYFTSPCLHYVWFGLVWIGKIDNTVQYTVRGFVNIQVQLFTLFQMNSSNTHKNKVFCSNEKSFTILRYWAFAIQAVYSFYGMINLGFHNEI